MKSIEDIIQHYKKEDNTMDEVMDRVDALDGIVDISEGEEE